MDLVGASELTNRYGQAKITYIIGSDDTDPLDPSMDQDCESELQGAYRVSRMQNFYDYLELIYGADVYNRHKKEVVDGYAHESQYIFGSTQGRNAFLEGFNFTLDFDTQGGSSVSDDTVASGATTTLPTAPTRSGYTFQNWNTLANGGGTAYSAGATYTMPSNDITLYAIWDEVVPSASNSESGSSGGSSRVKNKHRFSASSTTEQVQELTLSITEIVAKYRDQLIYAHSLGLVLPQVILDLLDLPTSQTPLIRDLTVDMSGEDVRNLQIILIKKGYIIPAGATGYFGNQTQSALASYQSKNNIIPASGYFGPITRNYMKKSGVLGVWW